MKIGGINNVIRVSLSEQSYIIFDYEATQTPKAFDSIPNTNIGPMTHVKQESKDQEHTGMGIERAGIISQDTGVASAYA
jgi:hypothetical protein